MLGYDTREMRRKKERPRRIKEIWQDAGIDTQDLRKGRKQSQKIKLRIL